MAYVIGETVEYVACRTRAGVSIQRKRGDETGGGVLFPVGDARAEEWETALREADAPEFRQLCRVALRGVPRPSRPCGRAAD